MNLKLASKTRRSKNNPLNDTIFEPKINQSEQSKQAYSDQSIFSGAEDGIQIEPLLDVNRLNYTLFFPNLEETNLLAFQLKQLKDHLELKGYEY